MIDRVKARQHKSIRPQAFGLLSRKIDLASEQLQQLLAKKPDDPTYNNDLGYIWADNGMKLDEAEKMIRKALELDRMRRQADPKLDPDNDRDNGAYLDSLGWVLLKKGNFKEAKKILLEATEDKATQHIEIFDHLGDAYMALGEKSEALAAWRKGLEFVGEGRRDLERKPASRRNEPAYLAHVARVVAHARGVELQALAETTTAAARALFRLPPPPPHDLDLH